MLQPTRRKMIAMMAGALAGASAVRRGFAQRTPQPMPSPNAPANQNVPAGLEGADIPWGRQRTMLPAAWMEVRSDTAKLLSMVLDFKERVDHTNLSATLPLSLIKEAHQIEKMARKIQGRMKS